MLTLWKEKLASTLCIHYYFNMLMRRIENDPHEELLIAAAEQMKITELRLHKLLSGSSSPSSPAEPAAVAQVEWRAGQIQAHLGALLAQHLTSHRLPFGF